MRNATSSGTHVREALRAIRDRIPPGWSVELGSRRGETTLVLKATDGRRATLPVLVRKRITPRDVSLLDQPGEWLLVAPFLSPRTREILASANASYVDGTGNLRLVVNSPAIFLKGAGADRNPDRQPRPLRSLKGGTAGRVVRALCDFLPPFGVRTLSAVSSTPLGTVSRVVSLLDEEALVTRDPRKQVIDIDWASLLSRWVQDYRVTESNRLGSYLEPRGLNALGPKLGRLERYAVTGSLAGTGIAPTRLAMLYVEDAAAAAEALELVPTEAGANVWLLEPFDPVVFERTQLRAFAPTPGSPQVVAAAPSQVAADLLTSPGRGPQEGEALIEKMKGTEDAWRRPT